MDDIETLVGRRIRIENEDSLKLKQHMEKQRVCHH